MDDYTKYKLAREIITRAIAIACSEGFDMSDPVIAELLNDERELRKFNEETINKIFKVYAPLINFGEING